MALLSAAALEGLWHRLGRRAGMFAVAAAVTVALVTLGARLPGPRLDRLEGQAHRIHAAVAAVAEREGGGALLDLPGISSLAALKDETHYAGSEPEAMLGSTRHWLPLLTGATDHPPPHRKLLESSIARLPASDALDDIVDMTHMRWVLLRPAAEWPRMRTATRTALLESPRLRRVLTLDGWELLRVEGEYRHAEWFSAIAAGERLDRTVLGTPLMPIPESAARAEVTATGTVWSKAVAGLPLVLGLRVRNQGTAPWPVTLPRAARATYTVRLSARWWPAGQQHAEDAAVASQEIDLRRDLAPGDEVSADVWLSAPRETGLHDLEIGVFQVGGARFDGPGNTSLRARMMLLSRVPPPAR